MFGLFAKKKEEPVTRMAAPETEAPLAGADSVGMCEMPMPGDTIVCDWIANNAIYLPTKLAAVDVASGRRHTYAEMHERVARVAGFLRGMGVRRNDRVAVLSMNSTDMLDIQFACWRIGAIYLPLNFRLTADELAFIIGDAEPKVLFLEETFAALQSELEGQVAVPHWISMDGKGGDTEFEFGMVAAAPVYAFLPQQPDDTCLIMYSSGTTGRPKGVMLSHINMAASVFGLINGATVTPEMVGLAAMPLFHIGGLNGYSTSCLNMGGTTVIMREFDPTVMLDLINDPELGVTHIMGVPAIYNALRAHPNIENTDFSRLKCALAGAEAVPEALLRWYLDRGITIQEVYGMTETTGGACILPKYSIPAKIGASGRTQRYCSFRIADEEGNEVPQGELGEILMRGAIVTKGYWNRPEANRDSFVDGYLRSGDVGRMDEEGFIYVEDRVKDMYISGGENVYPAEVENILYELEVIAEVAVIGVPDQKWGEVGCAVVVLKPGCEITLEEIQAHCQGRLAKYKHPVYLVLVDELPRNATGKVLKFELRKAMRDVLELG